MSGKQQAAAGGVIALILGLVPLAQSVMDHISTDEQKEKRCEEVLAQETEAWRQLLLEAIDK